MGRIQETFLHLEKLKKKALVGYIVSGDPDVPSTFNAMQLMVKGGVHVIELGIAFSDPMADGPVIQRASERALAQKTNTDDVFNIVKDFRGKDKVTPIILMGYYNMIYQYGDNNFINICKKVGVDGLIVVDLPYPENKEFAKKCKKKGISFIQLVSPTTSPNRMKKIIKDSHDMVYYISMLSTTGGKLKVSPKKILERYSKIKKLNKNKNIVIGFGITEKTIASLRKADGLVVGSALCKEISNSIKKRQNPVTNVTNIVLKLRKKIA